MVLLMALGLPFVPWRGRWLTFKHVPHMWTRLDGWRGTVRACRHSLPVGSRLLSATLNALHSAFNLHEENLIMTDRWESWDVSSPACYGTSWRAKDQVSWHVYKPLHHTRIQRVYKPLHHALKGKSAYSVSLERVLREIHLLFPQREHFLCNRISLHYLQAIVKSSQIPPQGKLFFGGGGGETWFYVPHISFKLAL